MTSHSEIESWKPIPGYEGLYDASNHGRIRTAPGKVTSSAKFEHRVWKSRIMKPKHPVSKRRQDERVSLWKDGVCQDYLVSRLIASAWIHPPEDGMTVNHKNGDWRDNKPENLEWISISDNVKHGWETGLFDFSMIHVLLLGNDDTTHFFRSANDASLFLGRNHGYVSAHLLRNDHTATSINGEEYTILVLKEKEECRSGYPDRQPREIQGDQENPGHVRP